MLNCDDYKFLAEFCKNKYGWDTITLTGGEPFMRKDASDIIDSLYNLGLKITVVSNGKYN